jgi:cytochrome b pre-mRNA-processing protein 3
LFGFFRRSRHERAGYELYGAAVAAARDPFLYAELGVPDSLDGRFDLVGLHVFLLIRRLTAVPPPGPAIAQAVFDAMFSDMDVSLRELGVGDLSVGRKVKAMWEAFHGRASAYSQAMDESSPERLAAAIERNVWRGEPAPEAAASLARLAYAQDAALAQQATEALAAGRVSFLPAAEVLR